MYILKNKQMAIGVVAAAAGLVIAVIALVFNGSDDQKTSSGSSPHPTFKAMHILPVKEAPSQLDFTLPNLEGVPVRISDFRGKVVFLNFWATWCGACVEEMPAMHRLAGILSDRPFEIVTISMKESAQKVSAFFARQNLAFKTLLDSDGQLAEKLGIRAIPTTLIIDSSGILAGIAVGARDWDSQAAVAMFKHLMETGI